MKSFRLGGMIAAFLGSVLLSQAAMQVGTNFWFAYDKGTATSPFNSTATFAAGQNPWKSSASTDVAAYNGPLRFMDWMSINHSSETSWSQRKLPNNGDQTAGWFGGVWQHDPLIGSSTNFNNPSNVGKGIAVEWLIDLCNRTNRDMWICVPAPANDAYVTNLARAIRYGTDGTNPYTSTQTSPVWAPLKSTLKVYVEYSNEVWNSGFGQNQYARQQGQNLGLAGDTWEKGMRFYGRRAGQIFNLWQSVWSGATSRVVKVIAGQNENDTWQADRIYDGLVSVGATANAWSTAPYFARSLNGSSSTYWTDVTNSINQEGTASAVMRNWANGKGYQHLGYEGGNHTTVNSVSVNRHSNMYNAYIHWLNTMNNHYDVVVHYAHVSDYVGDQQIWGAKNAFGESETTAHKYRALKNWVASNPGGGGGTPPLADGNYTLAPANATGLRLQATGTANGANVNLGTASSSNTQQWALTSLGGAVYRLSPLSASAQALDVDGQLTTSGANVQLWQYLGQANQKWTLTAVSGGYTLTPTHATGMRLNATGTASGSNVNQLTANGSTAQTWNIQPVSGGGGGNPVTLNPTADKDTQGSGSGTATTFNCSRWNIALFKFSLSSVGTVSNAKLRIYKSSSSSSIFSVYKGASDTWTEASGTTTNTGSVLATVSAGTAAGYLEFTVTGAVQQEAAGDDVITFAVLTSIDPWTLLNARENSANKPQLVITP